MAIHVVTVGVSVLANAARRGVFRWSPADEAAASSARADPGVRQALIDHVRSNPWATSAELNAMRPYLEEGSVEEVYLVGTATAACVLVMDVLGRVLREDFGVPVSGKGPAVTAEEDEERFARSLQALWEVLLDYVRHRLAEGKEVAINATGGLKPEMAVCLVVGNLTGVPVYYRHEHFDRTVVLPTLVWALCPFEIRESLRRLPGGFVSGPDAAGYYAQNEGARLERLRLVRVERDEAGEVFRVRLAPYGRLLLDLAGSGGGSGGVGR